jgi:hypothetical protein
MDEQEAWDFIDSIPVIDVKWIENDKSREQEYKNAMRSNDPVHLVGIIKNLYLRNIERENQGKKVHIIALLQRDQEIGFVITHQATHIVRSKTDINFWGLPSDDSIRPFVEQQYDLLIDTIGEENFFSQYIALRTTASLKVVYATPSEDPSEVFDLIIRGDGQVELKGFFNNVIEYLSMIKK